MKVFISWSGPLSHQVAIALRDWLPSVLQVVEPYVSSEDIDKGARWSTDISKELEDSSFGIICVTPENIEAPWVNFEAGALSKSLDRSRVAPFLFGVERTAVQGPLLQFQSTLVEEDDLRKLLKSLNNACEDHALDEARLQEIFSVWWPRLSVRLEGLAGTSPKTKTPDRPVKDLVTEVLDLVRGQQNILSNPELLLPLAYLNAAIGQQHHDDRVWSPNHPVYAELHRSWRRLQEAIRQSDQTTISPKVLHAVDRMAGPMDYLISTTRTRPQMRGVQLGRDSD